MTTWASLSPRNQAAAAATPAGHTRAVVDGGGPGARIGQRCHLNGLLIEAGADLARVPAPPAGVTEICPSRHFVRQQPAQQIEPLLAQRGVVQYGAGGDHGLGKRRHCRTPGGPRAMARRRRRVGRAMAAAASTSSARAGAWSGWTPSSSAAPRAAKAMARGQTDRWSGRLGQQTGGRRCGLRRRRHGRRQCRDPRSLSPTHPRPGAGPPSGRGGSSGCGSLRSRPGRRPGSAGPGGPGARRAGSPAGSRAAATRTRAMSSVQ